MKNKKTIMFFSALFIIIFHLWINVFNRTTIESDIEIFIRKICFIGVDMFFFLTSYTISKNSNIDYKKFILNRFINIYILFIIFSIIAFFINNWTIKELLFTISGIQLFIKGGGSFLWFIPAIMIVYLVLPIINKYITKHQYVILIIWLIITLAISNFTSYKVLFIFINRIPIMFIGCVFAKKEIFEKLSKKNYITLMIIFLLSILLLYKFYTFKFKYIYDIVYLISIPSVLGLIMLFNLINTNKIINLIASSTLEMYCVQMLFGYRIANNILSIIKNPLMTNIIVIIIIIGSSVILHFIKTKLIFVLEHMNKKITV